MQVSQKSKETFDACRDYARRAGFEGMIFGACHSAADGAAHAIPAPGGLSSMPGGGKTRLAVKFAVPKDLKGGRPLPGEKGNHLDLCSQNKTLTKITKHHISSRQPPSKLQSGLVESGPTRL